MRVVSFFAGCGGLDLGFEQAGFDVVWANEFEPHCRATYLRNHPDTEFVLGDICKIDPASIPDCDGFIGGPPCQSWSVAGKQKGLEDERGQLFLKYIDMIEAKQPSFTIHATADNFPPQITADTIKQKHDSYPYNKKIARVLYLSTFLEQWSSGAKRMIDLCREQNVAEPEWVAEKGSVKIVFWRPSIMTDYSLDVSQSGGQKCQSKMSVKNVSQNDGLNNRQIKIKIMIRDNDRITVTLISNALGVTPRTIYRDLKIIGIHWEGSPKTGHWVFD